MMYLLLESTHLVAEQPQLTAEELFCSAIDSQALLQ